MAPPARDCSGVKENRRREPEGNGVIILISPAPRAGCHEPAAVKGPSSGDYTAGQLWRTPCNVPTSSILHIVSWPDGVVVRALHFVLQIEYILRGSMPAGKMCGSSISHMVKIRTEEGECRRPEPTTARNCTRSRQHAAVQRPLRCVCCI